MNKSKAKLLICGDLYVSSDIENDFSSGNIEAIIDHDLLDLFSNKYDFITANLESPLTNLKNSAIKKNGPNMRSNEEAINGISKLNIDLVTLANNHILDYNLQGLNDTIHALDKKHIKHIGICNKDDYSNNGCVVEINNIKISYYTVCENEFSSYSHAKKGANSIELPRVLNEIEMLKKNSDILIVLYHGGKELLRYPTPFEQNLCRFFVDYGADFVVAQHSHCVGVFEDYKGKKIVYGQGNFIFGKSDIEEYQTSLLISLNINEKLEIDTEYIPIETRGKCVVLSRDSKILSDFYERSSSNFLSEYKDHMDDNKYWYYYLLLNKSKLYEFIDYHFFKHFLIKRLVKKRISKLLKIYNVINCETHREAILYSLKEEIEHTDKK